MFQGFLFAIGGFDGVAPLKTVEQYSPQSNRWTPVPDMSSSRFGLGACTCNGMLDLFFLPLHTHKWNK